MLVPFAASTAAARQTAVGQTITVSFASATFGASSLIKAAASEGVLFIFQLPAITFFFMVRLTIPGSALPSKNSRDAPPPVEMWLIRLPRPAWFTAATLSPPPITVVASSSASFKAMAFVPFAKLGISNTPMGPFHTTVFAPSNALENSSMVFGPMSKPIQPSGMLPSTTFDSASLLNSFATTVSIGSKILSPACSSIFFA